MNSVHCMIGLVSANQKTGKDKGGGLLFCALQILSETLPSRLRVRRLEVDIKEPFSLVLFCGWLTRPVVFAAQSW